MSSQSLDVQIQTLSVLRTWGPALLQQGESADPQDLMELLRLRRTLDTLVEERLGLHRAQIDRLCHPWCATLLLLPDSTDYPETPKWYGVHSWALVTDALPYWVEVINRTPEFGVGGASRSEVLQVWLDLEASRGREFINTFMTTEKATWRKRLDDEELRLISERVIPPPPAAQAPDGGITHSNTEA